MSFGELGLELFTQTDLNLTLNQRINKTTSLIPYTTRLQALLICVNNR